MLTQRSERVRQARRLLARPAREKTGLFLAEGPQAVREALAEAGRSRPGLVLELFISPEAAERWADLVAAASDARVAVRHAEPAALAGLSETVTPQGIVAVCRSPAVPFEDAARAAGRLVAVLADVRDPGNAGTVIRCADAAGADGVVLTRGSVDPLGGKAVRASAGSLFHLPIAVGAAPDGLAGRLRERGYSVLAADGGGRVDLHDAEQAGLLARPTAWMFGNEAHGLDPSLLEEADEVVRVPLYGRAESLNLATAAAICLYASARANRPHL